MVSHLKSIFIFILIGAVNWASACSMYKITIGDKTMVGCNEDAWRLTSKLWFESANDQYVYGAGFTGSRLDGVNRYAPQSGMNEAGLSFSRLSAYHPIIENHPVHSGEAIPDPTQYLKDILHSCATVEQVAQFIAKYDHSYFIEDVFIYIDASGDYLVVEPYDLISGNEPNYVLANFCPTVTPESNRHQARYLQGSAYIEKHGTDTTLTYCTALSDTMHVCRSRNGDGTLLTSIWDLKDRNFHLYFYHSYNNCRSFNLTEELAKGDHIIAIPELFPPNAQFERLGSYITPFNTPNIRMALVIIGLLLFVLSAYFLIAIFRKTAYSPKTWKVVFFFLNGALGIYMFVLATHIGIFYFDVPYHDPLSGIVSLFSYLPLLFLIAVVPALLQIIRFAKKKDVRLFSRTLFIANGLTYLLLLCSFFYWGLFEIF
jgi:hypothetical protein